MSRRHPQATAARFARGAVADPARPDVDLFDMRKRLPLNDVRRWDFLGVVPSRSTTGAVVLSITNRDKRTVCYVAPPEEVEAVARGMLKASRGSWWRRIARRLGALSW